MKTETQAISRARLGRARARLLEWYDANRRDLPWRRSDDPYAIWVSETMLQQTRVDTVIPYYTRFLECFPDLASLAEAELESVYGEWAGLGYYSRARNLHRAAQRVVEEYDGRIPDETASLRRLEGVGRYTAGAVASIAFDREEAAVDGNVIRVLSRFLGIRRNVGLPAVVEEFWSVASRLVSGPRPGDFNQALMELGAMICTPRSPDCGQCPLKRSCDGRRRGDAENLPRKPARPRPRRVEAVAAWIQRRGRALAVRPAEGGLLGGLWTLPGGELEPREGAEAGLKRNLSETLGLEFTNARAVGKIEHLFTHRRLRLHVFSCGEIHGRVRCRGFEAHRWLSPEAFAALPHGGPTRKALALLAEADPVAGGKRVRLHEPGVQTP